jgi:hypothetical protein
VQGIDGGQQVIGNDFNVRAHAAHQVQQRQAVEGPDRVVGGNDDAAAGGYAGALGLGQAQVEVEVAQDLVDEIEAFEMRVLGGEILEPGLVEEEAEEAAQGARRAFVAFKEIRVPCFQGTLYVEHRVRGPQSSSGATSLLPCQVLPR